jgi:hypothetical protein
LCGGGGGGGGAGMCEVEDDKLVLELEGTEERWGGPEASSRFVVGCPT